MVCGVYESLLDVKANTVMKIYCQYVLFFSIFCKRKVLVNVAFVLVD